MAADSCGFLRVDDVTAHRRHAMRRAVVGFNPAAVANDEGVAIGLARTTRTAVAAHQTGQIAVAQGIQRPADERAGVHAATRNG